MAAAGFLTAAALQCCGYWLFRAGTPGAGDQVLLNWLTLLLAPVSFVLRLTSPDSPVVLGRSWLVLALAGNAALYAMAGFTVQLVLARVRQKTYAPRLQESAARPH
jgi:hypothetical protein